MTLTEHDQALLDQIGHLGDTFLAEQVRQVMYQRDKAGDDPTNACRDCGIDNPVWFAPNEVWNAVMGDHTGFLCPRCFIVRAEASGLVPTAWVLTPERTTTGCGCHAPDADGIGHPVPVPTREARS